MEDRELKAGSCYTLIFSASVLLLSSTFLLYSLFCLITSDHHIALAIPNQLQKNRNNNNITNLTSPVRPVNHPPIGNVGPDQTVNESSKVMLVGVAVDPDPNDKLSYSWTQIAGPAIKLDGANTATPTFTAPSQRAIDTPLKFALIAKDNKGAASNNSAIVTVTVKHINHPPLANAGTDQTVNAGYIASLDGSKSKDPDNDPLTYSWTQIAGPKVKLNNANSPTCYLYDSL